MLTSGDAGFDHQIAENNHSIEFRHSLLADAQFDIPLASVNAESRSIVLAWAQEHGIGAVDSADGKQLLFQRSFDPSRDVLYSASKNWFDMLTEPTDRSFQPDLLDKNIQVAWPPGTRRIALPESIIRHDAATLSELFDGYYCPNMLYIIINAAPELDLQATDCNTATQQRWVVEPLDRGGALWDGGTWKYNFTLGEEHSDEVLWRGEVLWLVDKTIKGVQEGLDESGIKRFEFRLTVAVRK
jgi:hypothetical protein